MGGESHSFPPSTFFFFFEKNSPLLFFSFTLKRECVRGLKVFWSWAIPEDLDIYLFLIISKEVREYKTQLWPIMQPPPPDGRGYVSVGHVTG